MGVLNKDWQEQDQSGGYFNQEKNDIVYDENGEPLMDESILEESEYRMFEPHQSSRKLQKLNF